MIKLKAKDGCCEEASIHSKDFYIPCNAPAKNFMYSKRDNRIYLMCDPCANHSLKRGMVASDKIKEAITINEVEYVRKEKFNRCYDALLKVIESGFVQDSPFACYSEVLHDARELIKDLKTIRG